MYHKVLICLWKPHALSLHRPPRCPHLYKDVHESPLSVSWGDSPVVKSTRWTYTEPKIDSQHPQEVKTLMWLQGWGFWYSLLASLGSTAMHTLSNGHMQVHMCMQMHAYTHIQTHTSPNSSLTCKHPHTKSKKKSLKKLNPYINRGHSAAVMFKHVSPHSSSHSLKISLLKAHLLFPFLTETNLIWVLDYFCTFLYISFAKMYRYFHRHHVNNNHLIYSQESKKIYKNTFLRTQARHKGERRHFCDRETDIEFIRKHLAEAPKYLLIS